MPDGPPSGPREVESKLLISVESPTGTLRRLAELRSVGRYHLVPEAARRIHDSYLDLAEGLLGQQRIGVRLRQGGGTTLVTLKADSRDHAATSDRLEIELPWSRSALDEVFAELARHGIALPPPPEDVSAGEPLDHLSRLGFAVVQQRDLTRLPRAVLLPDDPRGPLAEMAIDTVVYHFGDDSFRVHEVEVEAKGSGDRSVVEEVTAALLDAFPDELRPWRYGKLPTGNALRDLLAGNGPADLIDDSGTVLPLAHELVDRALDPDHPSGDSR